MKKFTAFEPVLIRSSSMEEWSADFYDRFSFEHKGHYTISGILVGDSNILPYNEETKHLHNTIGEFTKWKPKKGEPILVRNNDDENWTLRIFLEMHSDCFVCTHEYGATNSTFVWVQAKPYTNPFKE